MIGHPARQAVLTAMARGLKDEAVAREVGTSVRTVRRHIAEYMTEVGAASRFQAGAVWAVELEVETRRAIHDSLASRDERACAHDSG